MSEKKLHELNDEQLDAVSGGIQLEEDHSPETRVDHDENCPLYQCKYCGALWCNPHAAGCNEPLEGYCSSCVHVHIDRGYRCEFPMRTRDEMIFDMD